MLKKRAHPTGIEHAKQRLRSEHNNHAARRPYYLLEWVHIRFLFAKFLGKFLGFSESDCEHPNFIIVPESPAQTTCPPQFSSFFTNETFFSKTRCIASDRKSTGGH